MRPASSRNSALQALTAAALLLPGLAAPAGAAEPGTLNLQVARYEEGGRDLVNVESRLPPLRADSLHVSGALLLRDSIRTSFALAQDTWSGATPVAVAPLAANGNRPILVNSLRGTVVAGASPLVNGRVPLDAAFAPADPRAVLIMASASPELRQQADVGIEFPLDGLGPAAALSFDAGLSDEPDYRSRYGRAGARFAFNSNLTTLSATAAFTRSDTRAWLDTDLLPYLTRNAYRGQIERSGGTERLRGERRDRSIDIGLTQVLDSASVFDAALTLNRARGFMENPYKAVTVIFAGPAAAPASGDVQAFIEQRPDTRRQLTFHAHLARHFAAPDATLQVDYTHSRDDWDIATHSLEFGWAQPLGAWTLTPRLRYYTQDAAEFHTPWLVSRQNYRNIAFDANGEPIVTPYSAALLPAHFSSDHRLAAFGSASAGLTVQRPFARGLSFEAGVEYYTRADGLHAGGGAHGSYADFDFVTANVALTVDLGASARRARREAARAHTGHTQHGTHAVPAGLMFAHGAQSRGELMTGYRVFRQRQHGALLAGTSAAADADVLAQGCRPAASCSFAPAGMSMTMHMFDLMYALSDGTTLMLMPQYMTMDMQLRPLAGARPGTPDGGGSIGVHAHGSAAHTSGAVGDTVLAGIFRLHASATHSLHASLGISAPTGKTDLEYRREFQADGGLMHYDMQTGSGTWDLLPALTWSGTYGPWQHGAQLSGIRRLERRNAGGYRLGDQAQLSAWTSRALATHLSASLRAVWQHRGAIEGAFDAYNAGSGPMDFPANHGGEFVDLGVGLNLDLAGSQLALEWLAPVYEDVNGFQLERQGTLSASWHYNY